MSAIYSKATPDVAERAKALIEKHHFELEQHKLRIDLIFANSAVDDEGQPTGPAVSHGGYAALAVARNLSTKDRVMGRGDCEIVIDHDRWPLLTDAEKDALLDHELYHFQVQLDKYGMPKLDDIHRPKLKLRKHDHQFGWFDAIARRHGAAAIEVRQFQQLCADDSGQYYLPFIGVEDQDSVKESVVRSRQSLPATTGEIAREFVRKIQKPMVEGGSVTVTSGGKGVKITKDAVTAVEP